VLSFFKDRSKSEVDKVISRIELKLGAWLRGQFSLMIIISIATYVGLTVLGVNYAVALAITAGLLEAVPIIGPLLAVIPAILVASSPEAPIWQPFAVLILYFVIQQMEGNLIVPRVMNEAVGIHPVIIIFAVMVGIKIAGPLGSFIAIPVTAIIMIFYEEWMITRRRKIDSKDIFKNEQKPTKEKSENKKTNLAKK
jgi:predicted PurR-regulated permease PerM